MSTFTKEQLIEKLQHRISVASRFPESEKAQMDLELARIALASLEAEPVAWAHRLINKRNGVIHPWVYGSAEACPSEADIFNIEVMPLYTAQPAPVSVPVALNRLRSIVADPRALPRRKEWISGQQYSYVLLENVEAMVDDACRTAMLHGSEPETDNTNQQSESLDKSEYLPVHINYQCALCGARFSGDVLMTRHQRRRYTTGAKIFLAVYMLALVAAIAGVVHYV